MMADHRYILYVPHIPASEPDSAVSHGHVLHFRCGSSVCMQAPLYALGALTISHSCGAYLCETLFSFGFLVCCQLQAECC